MDDPGRLRISDQDRHTVAEVLRQAAGEGRIDLEELDERLEAAYQAKTYGELVPAPRPATTPPSAPGYTSSFAVMSESKRVGSWVIEEQYTAFALMGSVV